jgi:hypothetical protein
MQLFPLGEILRVSNIKQGSMYYYQYQLKGYVFCQIVHAMVLEVSN